MRHLRLLGAATLLLLLPLACASASGESTSRGEANGASDVGLIEAAAAGNHEAVVALIAAGSDLEARDRDGRTALLLATHRNDVEIARSLIEAGADVNAVDGIKDTPYLFAAAEGRLEILRLTLAHGADLRSVNRYGGAGLIPAAHHGFPDVVRELLLTDIDIDHVNNLGWTALLEAVILGNGNATYIDIARQLVEAGADVNIADRSGVTPLRHARNRGFTEIALILEKAGGH